MNRFITIMVLIIPLTVFGCGRPSRPALIIDGIEFSSSEFNQAFQNSRFVGMGASGRKQFIDEFIANRLILKEAERRSLNKNPDFLLELQNHWEQALMRLMLEKISQEMLAEIVVNDQDIHSYYNRFKDTEFANMKLPDVYQQIKWMLSREKQRKLLAGWVESLKADAVISLDYERLGILQPEEPPSQVP